MDELASSLLNTLKRSSAPVETKLSLFNSLKSSIKHQRIPESAQAGTIECIRFAIASQTSAPLVTTGFSALGHLIKRLAIQDQTSALFTQRANLLPTLLERLGDTKDAHRAGASQVLCDLWPLKQAEVEKVIREGAILGSNARAKEAGMAWVTKMHTTQGLQFRGFVPPMVECLEDADGAVRESAKINLLELFRDARDNAKADLRRQLVALNVRKSIASHILSHLQISMPSELQTATTGQSTTRSEAPIQDQSFAEPATADNGQPPPAEIINIEPFYVQSQRELEDLFRQMQPCFEDKEKEENWKARDTNIMKLRRLMKGNAFTDHPQIFTAGIKHLLDGILKVANSLRTTMSTNGCQMVQELARTLGPSLDPMVEILLQGFDKMSASTKHIAAQNADQTIDQIFARVSYNSRLIQHIWHACQDKNVQPRCFAAGWLKTILRKQVQNKAQFEHSGGLDIADKCIKKCLLDANPKVRETMRGTYWMFAQAWPDKAESIMAALDAKSKQLLEKDPSNPNAAIASTSFTSSVGPVAAPNPRAATSSGRLSLKETIAAQKKASLAAQRLPERPSSAMSTFSPVRQAAPSSSRPAPASIAFQARAPPSVEPTTVVRPTLHSSASTTGHGLMSAPIRRPRRPDLPRPATADLYATGRTIRGDTSPKSPVGSPTRLLSKPSGSNLGNSHVKLLATSSRALAASASERSPKPSSPRTSPARARQRPRYAEESASKPLVVPQPHSGTSSPTIIEQNFTLVIPNDGKSTQTQTLPYRVGNYAEPTTQGRLSLPSTAEEEDFTLVIPQGSTFFTANPPNNTYVDPLTASSESPVSLRRDMSMDESMLQHNQVVAFDFGATVHDSGGQAVAKAGTLDDEQLLVFEDHNMDDTVAPTVQEPRRTALEELPLNERHPQQQSDQQDDVQKQHSSTNNRGRSVSPTKRDAAVTAGDVIEDRAETLRTRRLLASGIGRIRARTLDLHGFRKLQELVKENSRSKDLAFAELLHALTSYLESPPAESAELASTKTHTFKTQALACIRTIVAMPLQGDARAESYADALCVVVLEAGAALRTCFFGNDLENTVDEIILHAGDQVGSCLERMIQHDWRQYSADAAGHKLVTIMALSTTSKVIVAMRAREERPNLQQRGGLASLMVQSLCDLDVGVRKAGMELCMELHTAFGKEHEDEFWKALQGAGEGQLNVVAYYLARRGKA